MKNPRSKSGLVPMVTPGGRKAKNHFTIRVGEGLYCISYNSVIALYTSDKIYLDKYFWDYSATTAKHRREFLNEGIKDTRKKILSGEYELVDLNK